MQLLVVAVTSFGSLYHTPCSGIQTSCMCEPQAICRLQPIRRISSDTPRDLLRRSPSMLLSVPAKSVGSGSPRLPSCELLRRSGARHCGSQTWRSIESRAATTVRVRVKDREFVLRPELKLSNGFTMCPKLCGFAFCANPWGPNRLDP